VLSADAAGYSRLMAEDEAATIAGLGAARSVFRERAVARGGRIVDTAGDSVLALFESVVEAIRSAVEVQEELGRRSDELPQDRRMPFRIGINAGEVVEEEDGTVYGDAVNVAARLQAIAEPGGICVSEVVRSQASNKAGVRFEFLGEQLVKNIATPVRAYRVARSNGEAATPPSLPLPSKPSIAVLPFANMSGDPDQEYFSDGITEDLITALSRVRWLFVIARNSTFTYKRTSVDAKQLGTELGVRYVLEGSVRKGGSRVRITAQLIDATTNVHVWAERYDRELADVFAVQDEITETIARTIEPELARAELERARRKPPESLDAWDLYQRGLWHVWQYTPSDNEHARSLFEQAIRLDPTFSPFVSALALTRLLEQTLGYREDAFDAVVDAVEIAKRAVALDGKDATAHSILGRTLTALGDHEAAIAELRTALRLNPNVAHAHFGLGMALVLSGRGAEAVAEFDAAERLSPHEPHLWLLEIMRAWAFLSTGDVARAVEDAQRCVRHLRARFPAWGTLAAALGHAGRLDEGREALARTRELRPDFGPALISRIWPRIDRAFLELFTDGLRKLDPAIPDARELTW